MALSDIGDFSDATVLDLGTGSGTMASALLEKITNGRLITIDLYLNALTKLRKQVNNDTLLLRAVFVKADLRRLDFLRSNLADLVVSYDTLSAIEFFTPGGLVYVLDQVYRIMKTQGWFVAIEHWPIDSIRPVDKAQEVEICWRQLFRKVYELLGEAPGLEYTPEALIATLKQSGFKVTHWKKIWDGEVGPFIGIDFLTRKARQIENRKAREEIILALKKTEQDGRRYGMRNLPYFAVYTKKTVTKPRKRPLIGLENLYKTVRHMDILS